jgi:hypothetical protein
MFYFCLQSSCIKIREKYERPSVYAEEGRSLDQCTTTPGKMHPVEICISQEMYPLDLDL